MVDGRDQVRRVGAEDADLVDFAPPRDVGPLEKLESLNLFKTKVGDAGLEHLLGLKSLKRLYLWQSAATDAGIAKLKEALPELEKIASIRGQGLIESLDVFMSERDRDTNPAISGTGRKRAGVGIYFFQEDYKEAGEP